MRIMHEPGRGEGHRRGQDRARMSVLEAGKYLYYYPSVDAQNILKQWQNGITLEWEIDDQTRQPQFAYLKPAINGGTVVLRNPDVGSPMVPLPTRRVGRAVKGPLQYVEETFTQDEIAVRIPFAFRIAD
jgi:hypothetical protein